MVDFVKRSPFDKRLKKSYLRALNKNLDATDPTFAFKRDFGSHSAGFEGISVADDGSILVNMSVNENFRLVREMFSSGMGDEISTSALAKAMDDYGLDIKPGKPKRATVIRDGIETTLDYTRTQFAEDLAKVERGDVKSFIVKTPRATFDFTKSIEKGKELARALRREGVLRKTIEELSDPHITKMKGHDLLDTLMEQYNFKDYVLGKESAMKVLKRIKSDLSNKRVDEAIALLKRLRFEGRKIPI